MIRHAHCVHSASARLSLSAVAFLLFVVITSFPAAGEILFCPARLDFPAGQSPRSVVIADLNGDHVQDLAVAAYGEPGLPGEAVVLLGVGDGTFAEGSFYALAIGASSVAATDFNGDEVSDLAVAHEGSGNVAVLLGIGDGSFTEASYYGAGPGARCVAVGDLNGDQVPDLAVANRYANNVAVLLGAGNGSFGQPHFYGVGDEPSSVVIGDLNGDQAPDLAVANAAWGSQDVAVLLGVGDGTFAQAVFYGAGLRPTSVAIGDLNGDQVYDLVAANEGSDDVAVLLGVGDGSFAPARFYETGHAPKSVAIGDLNGDRLVDLAVAAGTDNVTVLLGVGGGYFAQPSFHGTGAGAHPKSVAIGDLNGDQALDLAVVGGEIGQVSVHIGAGDGGFVQAAFHGAGERPFSVAIGDLNSDQVLDLAVANNLYESHVAVLLGVGGGDFGPATFYGAGQYSRSVAIGDLNGDQVPDLAVANGGSDNVAVLLGVGDGIFLPARFYPAGDWPESVAIGDLNGDQVPDLAVGNELSDDVAVLLGIGDGSFTQASFYAAGDEPQSVAIGDLNGDHVPDLAVANHGLSGIANVAVLFGVGDGSFGVPSFYGSGRGPNSVAIGDLNDDHVPDLAVATSVARGVAGFVGAVAVHLGIGDGTFADASFYSAGHSVRSVAIGDLNGDQMPDLAAANAYSNNVAAFVAVGNGDFTEASFYGSGAGPTSVAIGDLNGDQMLDLAVANDRSDDVAILIGCELGPAAVEATLLEPQRPGPIRVRNRPNPFTQSTEIVFSVPAPGPVTLGIYNVAGRLVRMLLANETVGLGEQRISWDGRADDGRAVKSGVCFYRLRIGREEMVGKLHIFR